MAPEALGERPPPQSGRTLRPLPPHLRTARDAGRASAGSKRIHVDKCRKGLNENEYVHNTRDAFDRSRKYLRQIHLSYCEGIHSHPNLSTGAGSS